MTAINVNCIYILCTSLKSNAKKHIVSVKQVSRKTAGHFAYISMDTMKNDGFVMAPLATYKVHENNASVKILQ